MMLVSIAAMVLAPPVTYVFRPADGNLLAPKLVNVAGGRKALKLGSRVINLPSDGSFDLIMPFDLVNSGLQTGTIGPRADMLDGQQSTFVCTTSRAWVLSLDDLSYGFEPTDSNALNTVVGTYLRSDGDDAEDRGWIWRNGVVRDAGPAESLSVNGRGQVAGFQVVDTDPVAFMVQTGKRVNIGKFEVRKIFQDGSILGFKAGKASTDSALLDVPTGSPVYWRNGRLSPLPNGDWLSLDATDALSQSNFIGVGMKINGWTKKGKVKIPKLSVAPVVFRNGKTWDLNDITEGKHPEWLIARRMKADGQILVSDDHGRLYILKPKPKS